MTQYQIAQLKRAIKRSLTKEVNGPQAQDYKSKAVYNFPEKEKRTLPDYIAKNPWY